MKNLCIFFLATLMTSCLPAKQTILALDNPLPALNLPYRLGVFEVIDERPEISEGEIRIPSISFPKQHIRHYPALVRIHEHAIKQVLLDNLNGEGAVVNAQVYIMESFQEFSATWNSETERGYSRIMIKLFAGDSGEMIVKCLSDQNSSFRSLDASLEKIETLYLHSLRNSTYRCLNALFEKDLEK